MILALLAQKGHTFFLGANLLPVHFPGGRLPMGLAAVFISTTVYISPTLKIFIWRPA
jgi:hypothetical protein